LIGYRRNAAPEKSLQKNLSRKIARFLVSKISPATGVKPRELSLLEVILEAIPGSRGSMVMGSKLRFAFVITVVAWHSSDAFVPLPGSLHYHDLPCATRYPGRSLQGLQMKEHQRNTYTQALPTNSALRNTDRGSGSKLELFRGKIIAGAAVLAISFGAPQPSLAGQAQKNAAGVFV